MSIDRLFMRLAVLAQFAELSSSKRITLGRTAVMKLCFFLQESFNVDLGYTFSLYSYGPFDADVLSDLGTAVRLNVLSEGVVYYSSGTGYEYKTGSDIESVRTIASEFLTSNQDTIGRVLNTFGGKTAGELELLSTVLFVAKYQNPKSFPDLTTQVHLVKPHFSVDQIQRGTSELISLKLLRSNPA